MLLEQALSYLQKGISIAPCRLYFDDKGKCKKPATVKWTKYQTERVKQTTVLTQWKKLLVDQPGVGVVLITGAISNLLVVDVDNQASLDEIKPYCQSVKTVVVKTPRSKSEGWHLYFQYREGLNTTAGLNHDGLDIRAEGGYVVAPPSQYPDGTPYEFLKGFGFGELPIAKMPDELFNYLKGLLKDKGGAAGDYSKDGHGGQRENAGRKKGGKEDWFKECMVNGIDPGSRVIDMVKMIGYMLGRQVPKEIIRSIMIRFNASLPDPLTDAEMKNEVLPSISRIVGETITDTVEELNKTLSLVTLDNGDRVISEIYYDYNNKKKIRFSKISHVRESYLNKTVLINKKPETKFDIWRTHPDKREHKGVIFNPSREPWESGEFINLWKGIQLKPRKGDWSKFRWHIENIISKDHYEWILQWMAKIVQDPGGPRPGTVIVMRGGQGCGKGTFANIFGSIFGDMEYFFRVSKIQDLTGKFNEDLKTALLLHIDEATWGGDKETAGVLKSLITEPTRRIEPKGINAFHVENYLSVIISSNNSWIVPGGPHERRFLTLDIPDTKMGDWDYFDGIRKQMYRQGGLEAMYYDLLQYPYDLKFISTIPNSPGTADQILRSLSMEEDFWFERLSMGTLIDEHRFWKLRVAYDRFYTQYLDFCEQRGVRRGKVGRQLLGQTLSKLCPAMTQEYPRRKGSNERYRCKRFPHLTECRLLFEKYLGTTINWMSVCEPDGITEKDRLEEDGSPYVIDHGF